MNVVEKAIQFAAEAYDGKNRPGTRTPFIVSVMERVVMMSYVNPIDTDMMAAAALLRLTQNTDVTFEQIEAEFGTRIKNILLDAQVADYSDFDDTVSEESLEKEAEGVKRLPLKVKMLILAEKLAAIKTLQRDYSEYRESLWDRLPCKNPKALAVFYYQLIDTFHEFQEYEAFADFNRGTAQLFVAFR